VARTTIFTALEAWKKLESEEKITLARNYFLKHASHHLRKYLDTAFTTRKERNLKIEDFVKFLEGYKPSNKVQEDFNKFLLTINSFKPLLAGYTEPIRIFTYEEWSRLKTQVDHRALELKIIIRDILPQVERLVLSKIPAEPSVTKTNNYEDDWDDDGGGGFAPEEGSKETADSAGDTGRETQREQYGGLLVEMVRYEKEMKKLFIIFKRLSGDLDIIADLIKGESTIAGKIYIKGLETKKNISQKDLFNTRKKLIVHMKQFYLMVHHIKKKVVKIQIRGKKISPLLTKAINDKLKLGKAAFKQDTLKKVNFLKETVEEIPYFIPIYGSLKTIGEDPKSSIGWGWLALEVTIIWKALNTALMFTSGGLVKAAAFAVITDVAAGTALSSAIKTAEGELDDFVDSVESMAKSLGITSIAPSYKRLKSFELKPIMPSINVDKDYEQAR